MRRTGIQSFMSLASRMRIWWLIKVRDPKLDWQNPCSDIKPVSGTDSKQIPVPEIAIGQFLIYLIDKWLLFQHSITIFYLVKAESC